MEYFGPGNRPSSASCGSMWVDAAICFRLVVLFTGDYTVSRSYLFFIMLLFFGDFALLSV